LFWVPPIMRIASSMRRTPSPVVLAVSSACEKLSATNEIAPRLYTSSGWATSSAATNDGRSARSPGTSSMNGISSTSWVALGLFCPFTMP
jgi:hypothetical protein